MSSRGSKRGAGWSGEILETYRRGLQRAVQPLVWMNRVYLKREEMMDGGGSALAPNRAAYVRMTSWATWGGSRVVGEGVRA